MTREMREASWDRFAEMVAELVAKQRRMEEKRRAGMVLVRRRVQEYRVERAAFTVREHDGFYWMRPAQPTRSKIKSRRSS